MNRLQGRVTYTINSLRALKTDPPKGTDEVDWHMRADAYLIDLLTDLIGEFDSSGLAKELRSAYLEIPKWYD